MKPSRLLVVNCNISESITEVIDAAARAAASPSTQVVTLAPTGGVASAEGYLDGHLASVAMLDAVRRYEQPYDAVVLAGFGEPGREAFRELLDVPVVDITDAAAHLALMIAPRFGVVTSLPRAIVQIQDSLHAAGVAANCVGVRAADLPVLKVGKIEIGPASPLVVQAQNLLAAGAETLVLGLCGPGRNGSGPVGLPRCSRGRPGRRRCRARRSSGPGRAAHQQGLHVRGTTRKAPSRLGHGAGAGAGREAGTMTGPLTGAFDRHLARR
jgi:allantoin racemase